MQSELGLLSVWLVVRHLLNVRRVDCLPAVFPELGRNVQVVDLPVFILLTATGEKAVEVVQADDLTIVRPDVLHEDVFEPVEIGAELK